VSFGATVSPRRPSFGSDPNDLRQEIGEEPGAPGVHWPDLASGCLVTLALETGGV
jgi:hypothetical protein